MVKTKLIRMDSLKGMVPIQNFFDIKIPLVGSISVPIVKGDFMSLPLTVREYIAEQVDMCTPTGVWICDGSEEEASMITQKMEARGMLHRLGKMNNCFLARTDPDDVARVEGKTFIVTENKYDSVPHVKDGVKGILGQWKHPDDMAVEMNERFPGCMKGRVMFVIPFSMGPVGSPLSKIGVQLTDSNYVVLSMRIMTRVSPKIWDLLKTQKFVGCLHSLGAPRPTTRKIISHWPCNPSRTLVAHFPDRHRIMSYGSGYGGNSLLGKKCFALRIASRIARDEGWLAEHMLIMGVTNPQGEEKFIAAAFPSACGKTNMAMMTPSLPGWSVRVVGDDIAWLTFDRDGQLRAINPEAGFFGVAPGTNRRTNPVAMDTCASNTIFTNVAETTDGGVFWEGLERETDPETELVTWRGEKRRLADKSVTGPAAHPNSRFCCPAAQCPIIHPRWEAADGVPISAVVFGGRRPRGVPLVYEARSWEHGVMVGAALKSEATAAAEHAAGRTVMHDPMAMRPFLGYNFGSYLQHWLSLNNGQHRMPKVFHVNWFRLDDQGKFMWPGFGENIRVIDWMFRRINGVEGIAEPSPLGLIPTEGSINTENLDSVDMRAIYTLPKDYLIEDIRETKQFLSDQVGCDLPERIQQELDNQEQLILDM